VFDKGCEGGTTEESRLDENEASENGGRLESALAARRRVRGCRSIVCEKSDADDDIELGTRPKLPEVRGESKISCDGEDTDLDLRKGSEGGVCVKGMRGDDSLLSTVRVSSAKRM
jgi:hypothetical protein